MERIVERCAGLDVHKASITACVRTPGEAGGLHQEVREFSATTRGLLQLRDWLASFGVTLVGMEATGVYWKPVYYLLDAVRPPQRSAWSEESCRGGGRALDPGDLLPHSATQREPYQDLGEAYFNRRRSEQAYRKRLVRQLERLGHRVVLEAQPQPA